MSLLPPCAALAGEPVVLSVVEVTPTPRQVGAPVRASINIRFDRAVDPDSVSSQSVRAFGRWSGPAAGTLTLAEDDHVVVLDPAEAFSAGELVTVYLSNGLRGADGSAMRPGGHAVQFWTRSRPASLEFTEVQTLSTNGPGESSRPYGGIGSDLDGDGRLDLTIVNEDTADLRVFMNQGGERAPFAAMNETTYAVDDRASPSEPADFDGDGHVDICVANINTNSVSVLLGNGDGSFGPQQQITVGAAPRGIAVLDVEGDGDIDIVNTNANSGSLSLLLNDGEGVFGQPSYFDGGGLGEWALAAADMNDDGLLDLVVGARTSQTIEILLGQGDGTFVHATTRSAGGQVWMLVVGDVNGDGRDDVATANSGTNTGSILLGDGHGGLGPATTYPTDPFPLATDLGDMDGDGDLDWSVSSFTGDWWLLTNDGSGAFAFDQDFDAPANASCSIMLDIDNDRDLDLALIDEIEDVVIVMRQGGIETLADVDGDGDVDVDDLLAVILAWGDCPGVPCPADVTGDGTVNVDDLIAVVLAWS